MQSLLQTQEWASLRQGYGWQAHWVDNILVLEKPLPLGLSFLYSPEVDFYAIDWQKKEDPSTSLRMPTFLQKVQQIAKNSHAIFIRLDFLNKNNTIYSQKISKVLQDFGFRKAFEEIQPEFRQIIDLAKSEEQILAQMKQKGRYNIKIAQKHGVVIEKAEPSASGLDDFYRLFRETASRDGFATRPKKYFADLLKTLDGKAELLVARYQNKVLAAGIFTFYQEIASYLYGASGNANREVMAPYLLHWEAIKEAKQRNCKIYDLLAISPFEDIKYGKLVQPQYANIKKLISKYSGITRFKEQFGGQKVALVGSWDLVLKPVWYSLFKTAERLRRR